MCGRDGRSWGPVGVGGAVTSAPAARAASLSIPLSVLDLAPVGAGSTPADALDRAASLAVATEALGYRRYWVAEHHNMPGIASSAPAVLLAHVGAATQRIRIGSGGVMLPNHAPLVVAEQFGMLEALHPGRVDLGIGRAPGTDPVTAAALRRTVEGLSADDFPQALGELLGFFDGLFPEGHPYRQITAVPGLGYRPAIWLLGSSDYSAQVAGILGLPFSFAHHFAAAATEPAVAAYRSRFRPSDELEAPYVMLGVAVLCAETEERARWLAGSGALAMARLRQGRPGVYPTPEEAAEHVYTPLEKPDHRAVARVARGGRPRPGPARVGRAGRAHRGRRAGHHHHGPCLRGPAALLRAGGRGGRVSSRSTPASDRWTPASSRSGTLDHRFGGWMGPMTTTKGDDGHRRCSWGAGDPDYRAYHDDEWGRPVTDDVALYEKLCLEGFQSGLSWLTILRKRENFRRAFAGFDPERGGGLRRRRCPPPARRRRHRAPPGQDRGHHRQRPGHPRGPAAVRLVGRAGVVVRAVPSGPGRPHRAGPAPGQGARVGGPVQDAARSGLQVRRAHHPVRGHAVAGPGQRPPPGLLGAGRLHPCSGPSSTVPTPKVVAG